DHFHPEWKPLLSANFDKDDAMGLDAGAATHPVVERVKTVAEAEAAFDAITYRKGAAIIRMLEDYSGEDAWRSGIRAYLRRHEYGNARSGELWAAIDKAAGKPVSGIARTFTLQPGVPLILVSSRGGEARLSQERFGTDQRSIAPLSWQT